MTPLRAADTGRGVDTETAILDAGRDLLAEGGIQALSMRAVASRVGISATAIYNYFENKQALVERVVRRGFERFDEYLRAAVASAPKGSADRLYALGQAYIRFALENREYFRVLFTMQSDRPRELEELPEGGGYYLLRQCVEEAMEAGEIRRGDPDLVVLYLWSHVHGLVTLFLACRPEAICERSGERLGAPELFERFRDFMRNGLRPSASGVETARLAGS